MGAWATTIFADDTAADTRNAFTDLIAEGMTPAAATKRLIAASSDILAHEEDACVFWLALAATQWSLGRLINRVRDCAVEAIDSGADLRRWKDASKAQVAQRKKHLAKLRSQLLSPPPKPKKLAPFVKSSTGFKAGDIALYRLSEKTAVRFCVLQIWGDRGGTYVDICLLELDDGTPNRKRILKLDETLGPHYTMLSHEPADPIVMLRRGVIVPKQAPETFRAWNNLRVNGHACTWDDFPAALRKVLPRLGWT